MLISRDGRGVRGGATRADPRGGSYLRHRQMAVRADRPPLGCGLRTTLGELAHGSCCGLRQRQRDEGGRRDPSGRLWGGQPARGAARGNGREARTGARFSPSEPSAGRWLHSTLWPIERVTPAMVLITEARKSANSRTYSVAPDEPGPAEWTYPWRIGT